MINGKILKQYENSSKVFSQYHDEWDYQEAYASYVERLPKETPDDIVEDILAATCYARKARAEHGPGDENLCAYNATTSTSKQMTFSFMDEEVAEDELPLEKTYPQIRALIDEATDQLGHHNNSPEQKEAIRRMCEDLLEAASQNTDHTIANQKDVYVDPPEGWKYGFPKIMPAGTSDMNAWLVNEGYPEGNLSRYGDNLHCRIWDVEE